MKFGTLEFARALERPELMAPVVFEALQRHQGEALMSEGQVDSTSSPQVAEIDPTLSDTAAFCEKYGIEMGQAANCVILEPKGNIKDGPLCACVVLGTTRADVNGLAKRTLNAKKVSLASMEKAVAESAMEFGAITPIGLPPLWPLLVDQAVSNSERVIIGSGIRKSKLLVSGAFLATLPGAQVLEGLGQVKHTT